MKLKLSILLAILALTLPASLTADDNIRKAPNIILIMADDMAWADVGYNGQQNLETPHICLLYTSPSPRDQRGSRMPSSA